MKIELPVAWFPSTRERKAGRPAVLRTVASFDMQEIAVHETRPVARSVGNASAGRDVWTGARGRVWHRHVHGPRSTSLDRQVESLVSSPMQFAYGKIGAALSSSYTWKSGRDGGSGKVVSDWCRTARPDDLDDPAAVSAMAELGAALDRHAVIDGALHTEDPGPLVVAKSPWSWPDPGFDWIQPMSKMAYHNLHSTCLIRASDIAETRRRFRDRAGNVALKECDDRIEIIDRAALDAYDPSAYSMEVAARIVLHDQGLCRTAGMRPDHVRLFVRARDLADVGRYDARTTGEAFWPWTLGEFKVAPSEDLVEAVADIVCSGAFKGRGTYVGSVMDAIERWRAARTFSPSEPSVEEALAAFSV